MSSFGGILGAADAPVPPPSPPREEALRELRQVSAVAKKGNQLTIIMSVMMVLALLGGFTFIGRCASANVMASHLNDAKNEYIKRVKKLNDCNGPQHFASSMKLMDHVIELHPTWPEAYVYNASSYVIGYQQAQRRGKPVDPEWLVSADQLCDTAIEKDQSYPPAYFYKAMVAFYQGKEDCFDYLDKVLETSEKYYKSGDESRDQWKERVEVVHAEIKKNGSRAKIDVRPIRKMMPAFELVN